MNNKDKEVKIGETTIIISKQTRNLFILIMSIIIITIISGILGAFKSGKFYKTYDYVEVNIPYDELDYSLPIFDAWDKDSKEVIKYETEWIFDEDLGHSVPIVVKMYKGYNTKYFFQSSWFYAEALLNSVIVLMFYISLVNYLVSKRLDNDELYLTLEGELNQLIVVDNALPANSFEPFIERWNLARKKKQHISNVKYKLARLEQSTPYKVRREFYKKDEEGNSLFIIPERELTKKELKYVERKERLESYITKEYIEEHVEFEKVKHFKYIHASFVTTGNNNIIQSTDEYSSIKSHKEKQREDFGRKALIGMSISFAIASILSFTLFRVEEGWIIILYNVFMNMLPLLIQIVLAIDYVNIIMKAQYIPVARYRLNIANLYLTNEVDEPIIEPVVKEVSE